jgi:exopolyphosphatase/guanosine-5'-triphosphate,3'-diphosphate pyrophosphatase
MVSLNIGVNQDLSRPKINYDLNEDTNTLSIELENKTFLINSNIEKLELPKEFNLEIL